MSTAFRAVRRTIPAGRGLTDDVWRSRHRAILTLAWLHAVLVPAYGIHQNVTRTHALTEAGPIAIFALVASLPSIGRRARACAASAALLTSSAVLVHFSHGLIEMHFHFFVMVPIIALYQDWAPFLLSIAYVFIQDGLVGQFAPAAVFNHRWGQAQPWKWAAVHALFIAGTSAVCLATWRLNENMHSRQRTAENELLDEKRFVETLHSIGTGVVSELDLNRVSQMVTNEAVHATGAAFGAFFYNTYDSEGESYMLYTLSGAPRSAFSSFPMPRNTKIFEPTFTGAGPVRIDDVVTDPRYGGSAPYHGMPPGHPPVRSYLAVPVHSRGSSEVLGGLFFGHPEPAMFSERDERIAIGIATQAAIAFDNARLYQAERDAYDAAESARARVALLAEAGRMLVSSLDPERTLENVAKISVPTLADICVVDIVSGDVIRRVTVHGADGLAEYADVLSEHPPDPANDEHPVVRVINGGAPELIDFSTPGLVERATRTPEHSETVRRMHGTSAIVVPLTGRSSVLGAVTFLTVAETDRKFKEDDLPLAEELGRRAGLAVENANLYNQQRNVAESLQHALLPQQLPDIPGFEAMARYLPGSPGERVGGDWYDLFEVPSGEIAVVIGDVVGHGIPAASLMAQLRNAMRAYVWNGMSPSDVLGQLNQLLYGLERDGMATASVGLLNPITSRLRFANAGHPPFLHVRGGEAAYIGEGLGPPLGAVPFARFKEIVIDMRALDTAVFYTDGLVEDRITTLDGGLERMRSAVVEGADGIDELCDGIVTSCLGGRRVEDDVAVLVLRSLSLGDTLSLHLRAEPRVLASMRQTMRRWLYEHKVSEDEAQDVLLACGEACNNAIEHGSAPMDGWFDVEAVIDGDLQLQVSSSGPWRAPRSDGGGRGLPVMQALMDSVDIDRNTDGIVVRLRRSMSSS